MANELIFKQMTAAQLSTYKGAEGEVVIDTTNDALVLMDGVLKGGYPHSHRTRPNASWTVSRNRNLFIHNRSLVTKDKQPIRELGAAMDDLIEIALTEVTNPIPGYTPEYSFQDAGYFSSFDIVRFYSGEAYTMSKTTVFPSNLITLYNQNTYEYLSKVSQILDLCANTGVGLIITFFDDANDSAVALGGALGDWGNTSSTVVTNAKTMVSNFVTAFADHPAIVGWSVGKGFDAKLTESQYLQGVIAVANTISESDTTNRVIFSELSGRQGAQHADLSIYADYALRLSPSPINAMIVHNPNKVGNRDFSDNKDYLIEMRKVAEDADKGFIPVFSADFVTASPFSATRQLARQCQDVIDTGVQIALYSNWSVDLSSNTAVHTYRWDAPAEARLKAAHTLASYRRKHCAEDHIYANDILRSPFAFKYGVTGTATLSSTLSVPVTSRANGFSYALWFKYPSAGSLANQTLMTRNGMSVTFDANENMMLNITWSDSTTQSSMIHADDWMAGQWYHVLVQMDTSVDQSQWGGMSAFINGVRVFDSAVTKTWNATATSLTVGFSTLAIAEFVSFNRTLLDYEVRLQYLHHNNTLDAADHIYSWGNAGLNGATGNATFAEDFSYPAQ